MDPKCADMNRGRQVIQAQAVVAADGSVADVFVRLEGNFPAIPAPPAIVIDQRSCVCEPRVVGIRVGQRLQVRSERRPAAQRARLVSDKQQLQRGSAGAGMACEFTPKTPEVMLKLGCDVHRWMVAFVGVMYPATCGQQCDGAVQHRARAVGSCTIKTAGAVRRADAAGGGEARRDGAGSISHTRPAVVPISSKSVNERQHSAPDQHTGQARIDTTPMAFADIGVSRPRRVAVCARRPTSRRSPRSVRQREAADLIKMRCCGRCSGWRSGRREASREIRAKPAIAMGMRSRAALTETRRKKPMRRRSKKPTMPMMSAKSDEVQRLAGGPHPRVVDDRLGEPGGLEPRDEGVHHRAFTGTPSAGPR